MKSNHRGPIWPYLGLLVCLFVLCVTAPRSWQRLAEQANPTFDEAPREFVPSEPAPAQAALPAPTPALVVATPEPVVAKAVVAQPAELILVPAELTVRLSDPSDRLAMRPIRNFRPQMQLPAPKPAPPTPQAAAPRRWTLPTALLAQLDALAAQPHTSAWASSAARDLRRLADSPDNTVEASALLAALRSATKQGAVLAQRAPAAVRGPLLRTNYALERRLDVWQIAQNLPLAATPVLVQRDATLSQPLSELAALTSGSEHGAAWRQYLMVDALQQTVARGPQATEAEKQELARQIIGRIAAARRSDEQAAFASAGPIAALDAALRKWTAAPVETPELLAHLEAYESLAAPSAARKLGDDYHALVWSASSENRELAKQVDRHYRNANLRIAVTSQFINRCLPQQPTVRARIREQILGADVNGLSDTSTDLQIRLLPEYGKLRLGLQAQGLVHSNTNSSSGPATFFSRGRTNYLAEKVIEVGPNGLHLQPTQAYANAASDLLSFDTDFDQLPVIRTLVRNVVRSQHEESHQEALHEMEWRVARTARERMDREADQKIAAAVERFEQRVWNRLKRMGLAPEPLELQTTDERLVMRLRMADERQLAAHTPRPQALSNSLASVQLHESLLNNAIAKLQLDGKSFALPELYRHIGQRLEVQITPPEDLPERTTIKFAAENSVHVQLRDGVVQLTLAIDEIGQPRNKFRDFKVIAFYRPQTDGVTLQLERDDTIRLIGRDLGLGGQLGLRAVFSKIFSKNRPLPIIRPEAQEDRRLAGLEIHQCILDDGWLGLGFAEPERRRTTWLKSVLVK